MGKVAMKGFDILSKQYKNRTVSRNEVKEANKGRYARYDTVSSNASLMQHQKQWAQFAKYVEDKHGLKGLKKLTRSMYVSLSNTNKLEVCLKRR